MPLATWHDSYATGIPIIDDQHKELFKAINGVHDAFAEGKPMAEVRPLMDFLMAYTISHFRTEESFMEEMGYPDLSRHQSEHALLLRKVQDLRGRINSEVPPNLPEVAKFIGDWLRHHIGEVDMGYSAYLKQSSRG